MAYANWLSPDKLSGNGNDTVNVSALSSNTGRQARSTIVTFKAAGVADVARTVNQAGKPETSAIQSTAAVNQSGGTLTLTGTSNSERLTFSKANDNIGLTIPANYTAAGLTTANGADISGDPGKTAEYNYSIQFTIAANPSTSAKTCQIIVTDKGGTAHTCTITLAAGAATLDVSPASVEIPWDASESKAFTVTSNTNWTVE